MNALYRLYARILRRQLAGLPMPRHIAIVTDVAAGLSEDDIRRHLYLPDLPDPELVIRTSGELRMSDFLLWQTTRSDIAFCDLYWPAFREVDLLRALRMYGRRQLERSS